MDLPEPILYKIAWYLHGIEVFDLLRVENVKWQQAFHFLPMMYIKRELPLSQFKHLNLDHLLGLSIENLIEAVGLLGSVIHESNFYNVRRILFEDEQTGKEIMKYYTNAYLASSFSLQLMQWQ